MELFIFVTWLVLSVAAAVYASNKGRSGAGIFFLSLFLSPLVGFLVAVAMEPNQQQASAAKGMKKCPDCAEFVQPDAKICRFCRYEFKEEPEPTAKAEKPVPGSCPHCGATLYTHEKKCYFCDQDTTADLATVVQPLVCDRCGTRFETAAAEVGHFCNPLRWNRAN